MGHHLVLNAKFRAQSRRLFWISGTRAWAQSYKQRSANKKSRIRLTFVFICRIFRETLHLSKCSEIKRCRGSYGIIAVSANHGDHIHGHVRRCGNRPRKTLCTLVRERHTAGSKPLQAEVFRNCRGLALDSAAKALEGVVGILVAWHAVVALVPDIS